MIVIAGAGLAGMSTGMFLKKEYQIFERNSEPGGRGVYATTFPMNQNTPNRKTQVGVGAYWQ